MLDYFYLVYIVMRLWWIANIRDLYVPMIVVVFIFLCWSLLPAFLLLFALSVLYDEALAGIAIFWIGSSK